MKQSILCLMALMLLFASCKKEDVFVNQSVKASATSFSTVGKRIYFNQPGNWVDGNNFPYSAGDTFVLTSGIEYSYFSMANVHDVTIINDGGIVHLSNGFNLNACTNVTISGTGTKDFYGIDISGHTSGDVGIDINGRSKAVKVDHVFTHDKTYGFWVKQEVGGTNDESLYYPNWYMDSISISYCMIKRMNQEGMYIGSTGQNADRANAAGAYPYPMRLSNVQIHDNIVDSTCRGGIMLSGADKGHNNIYNNTITRCGYERNSYQGNGIVIGGNAYADIDKNTIKNTLCDGIWVLGCGTTRVRTNKIDSSGWLPDGTYAGFMHGVSYDARPSYPFTLSTFRIRGNTIGKHSDVADIYIYNTMQQNFTVSGFSTINNLIYNNNKGKAVVATQPGIVYSTLIK